MKTMIKKIANVDGEGVTFILTEKANLGGKFKAKQWCVSWDNIGKALFKEQYSDAESVKDLQTERG